MIIIKTQLLKFLLLGFLFSVINSFSDAKENFKSLIESQSDNSIIFSFKDFHSVIKNEKSLIFLENNAPLNSTFNIDSNTLNNLSFTFCIPLDAINFKAEFIQANYDTIPSKHNFKIDRNVLIVTNPYLQRGVRLVSIKLNPYRYFDSKLLNMNSGKIKLRWDKVKSTNRYSLIEESKSVEEFFSSFVMNYQISKSWQLQPMFNNSLQSLKEKFGIGESIVMLTPDDGIYNISGKDALVLGVNNLVGKLFSEIRIKNKDKLIPFYKVDKDSNNIFDVNDEIEFYGARNTESDSLYYSDITDTNAYILTWNDGQNDINNIKLLTQSKVNFVDLDYQDTTLHFEKNNISFLGHTLDIKEGGDVRTIHNNNRVKGERYYWGKFSKPGDVIFNIPFECYPSFANSQKIKISTRLLGNSLRQPHNLTFRLNGKNFNEKFHINIYSDTLIEFFADQKYFIQGKNTLLAIIDDPLTDINNELYFDYLELNGKFSGANNRTKLYINDKKKSVKIPVYLASQESNIAFSEKEKIEIKDIKRGSLFNVTSRQMVGDDRQLPGFIFQYKDTSLTTLPYQLGIMAIEIDGFDGSILRTDKFDLYGSNASNEALRCSDFIQSSKDSNYLILGTTVGSGRFAKSVLNKQFQRIGVTKLLDPKIDDFVCSWIYAVKLGDNTTSQEYVSTTEDSDQGLGKNIFFENKFGNSFLGILNLDSIDSGTFNFSKVVKPKLLYSKNDFLLDPVQADLIIISHSNFIESANKLANYRTNSNGIKSLVVNVQDIYNEFNFGIKSPIAIRKFTDYIYKNYKSPKPAYLLLFGDASWDVSMSLPNSVKTDFVPSNGHPVSDYLYSVSLDDSINFTPNYFVGRLPVSNEVEAESIVNKLIEYDTIPPAWWNKRFLFVAGGTSQNQVIQERSRDKNLAELVLNNNYQGDTAFVFRTEKDPILQFPTTTDGYWVRDEVNKGCLHWSFSGHGSINNIDLDFGNAEDFNNGNKYFIVSSFSCQTGDFSDPVVDSRTERMVKIANKGAIAAIGNTSYSYTIVDNDLKRNFYEFMSANPLNRYLGHIVINSKYPIYENVKSLYGEKDNSSLNLYQLYKNHLLCHSLMGDPSMKIATRNTTELSIPPDKIKFINPEGDSPTPLDSIIILQGELRNYGMPVINNDTSITLIATLTNSKGDEIKIVDTVKYLNRTYLFSFKYPVIKSAEEYKFNIVVDPERKVKEEYLQDNSVTFTFKVIGNQPIPLEPLPFGVVTGYDNIKIRLINPPSGSGATIWVDTTSNFSSNFSLNSKLIGSINENELTTEWTFTIPEFLRTKKQFWWKAVSSSGDTSTANQYPLIETFTIQTEKQSNINFVQSDSLQLSKSNINDLVRYKNGIGPGSLNVDIQLLSIGQSFYNNGNEILQKRISMIIGGKEFRPINRDGLNVIVLEKNSSHPKFDTSFAFYQGKANNFIKFIKDSVKVDDLVLICASGVSFDSLESGSISIRTELIKTLLSIGCKNSNNLKTSDSYCLIGSKEPGFNSIENRVNADSLKNIGQEPPFVSRLDYILPLPSQSGKFTTPIIGNATKWNELIVDYSGSKIAKLIINGVKRNGVKEELLRTDLKLSNDLSSINVILYPRIEAIIQFPNDSLTRLKSIQISYAPSPELALRPSTFRFVKDSILQGDTAVLNSTLINLSSNKIAYKVSSILKEAGENFILYDSTYNDSIKPFDSVVSNFKILTNKYSGYRSYIVEANSKDNPSENYRLNNRLSATLKSNLDNDIPSVEIYADGSRLMSGDYVSPKAKFEFKINDNSNLRINDSTSLKLIFDNDIIKTNTKGVYYKPVYVGSYKASMIYQPENELQQGLHELKFFINDATGNADTIPNRGFLDFYVTSELKVLNVVNFPNPFSNKTDFTYIIGSETVPIKGNIKIFTLSGKKIKEIILNTTQLKIGFNKVEWNSEDLDGDKIANGIYLYKLTIENLKGESFEVIDKLAIVK